MDDVSRDCCDIEIVGYLTHGSRGGKIKHHQQDQVLGTHGIMKALTSGSHNNAEWMQFILEVYFCDIKSLAQTQCFSFGIASGVDKRKESLV